MSNLIDIIIVTSGKYEDSSLGHVVWESSEEEIGPEAALKSFAVHMKGLFEASRSNKRCKMCPQGVKAGHNYCSNCGRQLTDEEDEDYNEAFSQWLRAWPKRDAHEASSVDDDWTPESINVALGKPEQVLVIHEYEEVVLAALNHGSITYGQEEGSKHWFAELDPCL